MIIKFDDVYGEDLAVLLEYISPDDCGLVKDFGHDRSLVVIKSIESKSYNSGGDRFGFKVTVEVCEDCFEEEHEIGLASKLVQKILECLNIS